MTSPTAAGDAAKAKKKAFTEGAWQEARALIKGLEDECGALLRQHRNALDRLTAELLEHETVSGEVVEACLNA